MSDNEGCQQPRQKKDSDHTDKASILPGPYLQTTHMLGQLPK